ncbi:hypothetical protein HDU99_001238 [Rhizoclosmatium hyalinum]|nr:hypothetical protein HDU99_001238 [Rhizoclosmatium hyalinum]
MRIEAYPTHLKFAATGDGEVEHHQHNASLTSITDTLRNQTLSASNAALFTQGDFESGSALVDVFDFRYLNLHLGAAAARSSSSAAKEATAAAVPSVVSFAVRPSDSARAAAVAELVSSDPAFASNPRLMRQAADIEARILVATEPLDLDPNPEVEKRETLEAYNRNKYKALASPARVRQLSRQQRMQQQQQQQLSVTPPQTSPSVPSSNKIPPSSAAKPSASSSTLSTSAAPTVSSLPPSATNLNKLLLVPDLTNGSLSSSSHHHYPSGAQGSNPSGPTSSSTSSNLSHSSASAPINGSTTPALPSSSSSGFQPRFARLQFIEEYRKRKRAFDNEIMLGVRKNKKLTTDPLNNYEVIRTCRFEQTLTQGTVHTILNIVQSGTGSNEYEAVMRIGNEFGNAAGPFGTTLRYPIGNITAVDNYLGYFKSFFGLTHKSMGVYVSAKSTGAGGAVNGITIQGGTM